MLTQLNLCLAGSRAFVALLWPKCWSVLTSLVSPSLAVELLSELKPPFSSESSLEAALCSQEYEEVRVTLPPRLFSAPTLYDFDAEASDTVDRGRSTGLEADISFLSGPPALGSNIFGDLLCTTEGKSLAHDTAVCRSPRN